MLVDLLVNPRSQEADTRCVGSNDVLWVPVHFFRKYTICIIQISMKWTSSLATISPEWSEHIPDIGLVHSCARKTWQRSTQHIWGNLDLHWWYQYITFASLTREPTLNKTTVYGRKLNIHCQTRPTKWVYGGGIYSVVPMRTSRT
jgi:hypothetical protein